MQLLPALRVCHLHHLAVQPAEEVDALLPIGPSDILSGDDRIVEDGFRVL
jgi:hypothetical protein